MGKAKRYGRRLAAVLCAAFLLVQGQGIQSGCAQELVSASYDEVLTDAERTYVVEFSKADEQVIPDRFNTGCAGELRVVSMGDVENEEGVLIVPGSNDTRFILDFAYRNKDVTGTVVFQNIDFSSYDFWTYHEDMVERDIHVVFNNCKFARVNTGKTDASISYEFNRCTMTGFSGSDALLSRCRFGGGVCDGVVPFRNVTVEDCFFADLTSVLTDSNVHIDGTQLYGAKDVDVENVSFINCRFSVPALKLDGNGATVNACIMLQMEYSNARDVLFQDCIINGGGYSVYIRSVKDEFTLENIVFDGLRFGSSQKYGVFYPDVDKTAVITDIGATDSLYVGSVWWEEGETHFSVTNDTNRERILWIETDLGTYTYTIPACPTGDELTGSMRYEDMPFDLDIVIPAECNYAVCFDATMEGCGRQLRFVNRSEEVVTLSETVQKAMFGGEEEVLLSGSCGKTVYFSLTKGGVLTLSGTGATEAYHSAKFPAWTPYLDLITEIRVGEGVEQLNAMIFRSATNLRKVSLPDSLTFIGQYGFRGCASLTEVTLPAGLTELGRGVFTGTSLQRVIYEGDDWTTVTLGADNEDLTELVLGTVPTPEPTAVPTLTPTSEVTATPTPTTAPTATPTPIPTEAPESSGLTDFFGWLYQIILGIKCLNSMR